MTFKDIGFFGAKTHSIARTSGPTRDDPVASAGGHTPRSRRAHAGVLVAGLALGLAIASGASYAGDQEDAAHAQSQPDAIRTMRSDLVNRSQEIHWPDGFDPSTADLFSHNEIVVDASCEHVWSKIVDARDWPRWYPNSKDVRIVGGGGTVLHANSVFRWTTFGLPLESRIHEFVPNTRIGWYGYAPGTQPTFYHTWYLTPKGGVCVVTMDEVGKGASAIRLRQSNESLMHRGHDLWLVTLKWVSENGALDR
jgi:uncharacterized protein YndB with AHSA1/START domain